ncbi:MAG: flavodoxin family protein [Desulfobacteraceae bacterium]|nr:flavodoxin family protein [Desulfobacteraceae bacterium]
MKLLTILAHPDQKSLNHALAGKILELDACPGVEVVFHDLYAEGFDPLLTPEELDKDYEPEGLLKTHCDHLAQADGLVIIHPNWRDQPPAILKGWVDRVFRVGVAFSFEGKAGEEGRPVGALKADKALIINTSDCSEQVEAALGDPLQTLWERCILQPCGAREVVRRNFHQVIFSTQADRQGWLDQVDALAREMFLPA